MKYALLALLALFVLACAPTPDYSNIEPDPVEPDPELEPELELEPEVINTYEFSQSSEIEVTFAQTSALRLVESQSTIQGMANRETEQFQEELILAFLVGFQSEGEGTSTLRSDFEETYYVDAQGPLVQRDGETWIASSHNRDFLLLVEELAEEATFTNNQATVTPTTEQLVDIHFTARTQQVIGINDLNRLSVDEQTTIIRRDDNGRIVSITSEAEMTYATDDQDWYVVGTHETLFSNHNEPVSLTRPA